MVTLAIVAFPSGELSSFSFSEKKSLFVAKRESPGMTTLSFSSLYLPLSSPLSSGDQIVDPYPRWNNGAYSTSNLSRWRAE